MYKKECILCKNLNFNFGSGCIREGLTGEISVSTFGMGEEIMKQWFSIYLFSWLAFL